MGYPLYGYNRSVKRRQGFGLKHQNDIHKVVNRIQRKWGHKAIQPAHRIRQIGRKMMATGFAALDDLIQGVPYRCVTEIRGKPTSGMSTLVYTLMDSAQQAQQHVVFVDMSSSFDGVYAASCGVKVDELVLVEAYDPSLVLELLREIVSSGLVGLLLLNLLPIQQPQIDLRRVMKVVHAVDCAVVLLLPTSAQTNVAALRLHVQRQSWIRTDGDIVGCLSRITIEKQLFGQSGQSTLLLIPLKQEAWA